MSRPAIPREVARDILTEAGHRCSVCGTPSPLERAHIVPWSKSKSHDRENLICLCANCHERADLECWGEKTLRSYKVRPWVARQNHSNPEIVSQVEIVIDYEFHEFDETKEAHLLHAIAGFLRISPSAVRVLKKEDGSVRIVLELPSTSAEQLLREQAKLRKKLPFRLMRLKVLDREAGQAAIGNAISPPKGGSDLETVAAKHERNFEEIYRRYYSPVLGLFRRRGLAQGESEDLAQEVFLRAYRNLGTFEEDASFQTWLFGIAFDVWKNYLLKRRLGDKAPIRKAELTTAESSSVRLENPEGPLSSAMEAERMEILQSALAQLPQRMRQCVMLRLDGMKYREIAEAMEVNEATVKSQLYSARRKLGEQMKGPILSLDKVN